MRVDQSKYDRLYYTDNCEGYTTNGLPGERISSLLRFVPVNAKNILDIGCGRGEVAKALWKCNVISLDYSNASILMFMENNASGKTVIRHDLINGLRWMREYFFDAIVMSDVIEHIDHEYLLRIAGDIVSILKVGGLILIDTPIISKSHQSELHINLYESIEDVCDLFYKEKTSLVTTMWHRKPEHCHIILRRDS